MMRHNRKILSSLSIVLIVAVLLQVPGTESSRRLVRRTSLDLILTIQTERPYYGLGETAKIQGHLTDTNGTAVEGAKIAVEVKNPRSNTIFLDVIFSSLDGSFEDSVRIDGNAILGDYYVYSTANAAGYPITNAQTTFMVLTTANLSEKSSMESTLNETLLVHQAAMNDVAVSGNLTGLLDFTHFEMANITTGSFSGKGFSKGEWNATLEGIPYAGVWRGMLYLKPSERKIYLKGAVTGEVTGIVDGCLSETVNQSGIYDRYHATWTIGRLGTTIVSATLSLNGTLVYQSSSEYPATGLRVLQVSIEGSAFGHYNCSLSSTLTHIYVSSGSAYSGEGFSLISYCSTYGMGEGWAFAELAAPQIVGMQGFLTSPLYGIVYATLDETTLPRSLHLYVERVDLGLPPMADLKLRIWGPERTSPGQTITYTIEVRNDGLRSAENMTIICPLPFLTDFVFASVSGSYDDVVHAVRWDFQTILPRTVTNLGLQVRSFWGLDQWTQLTTSIEITTEEEANSILQHSSPGLLEWIKRQILQPTWVALKKNTLRGPGWYAIDFAEFTAENPYAIYAIRVNVNLRKALVEESPNLDYWEEIYRLVSVLQGNPHYLQQNGWQTPDGFTLPPGITFQEAVDALQQHYNYEEVNRYDKDSSLEISTARDPNVKYGLEGYASHGQILDYAVEYENEGEGIAYGVYITDTLDEDLDDMALEIGSVISTSNGSVIAEPGKYNPSTRTITWLVGEVGPNDGGIADFSAKVRNDAPEGTEIINSATVYFPSVPETTRTNTILSVVGHPNIAITGLTPLETTIVRGSILYLNLTLANAGYFAETFNVTIYANSTTVGTQNITILGRSGEAMLFMWNTAGFSVGNYNLSAYAWLAPGENDTSDNAFTGVYAAVTIPGDVDGDHDVDIFDIVRMAVVYGVKQPDPRYDPNCDIDGDGDIDIFDIVMAAGNYGESWP